MKKILLSLVLAIVAIIPAQVFAQKTFFLQGTVAKALHDVRYYIYIAKDDGSFDNKPTDSVEIKNHKFVYRVKMRQPRMAHVRAIFDDGSLCSVYMNFPFVPGEKALLNVQNGSFFLNGSKFYRQWNAADNYFGPHYDKYRAFERKYTDISNQPKSEERDKELAELDRQYMDMYNEYNHYANEYLKEHNDEDGTIAYFAMNYSFEKTWDMARNSVKNGLDGKLFHGLIVAQQKQQKHEEEMKVIAKATGEGTMFKDIQVEYNGKLQKLSDYVGRGKYVIVDFWASWCGPCRSEIPNLINVYNKYKGPKFDVVGVATWDKPEDTKKAIKELGIEYPQIFNAQSIGSETYGISGIPEIILFDPEGKVVERGLRGQAIEEAVSRYLK